MELGWGALVLLLGATAVVWFLQDSLAARESANIAAMEACKRLSLQFLDGTVAFARLKFTRGERGQLAIRRTYVFDYTAHSIERRQGFVILVGRNVESVGYAPGEERRTQPEPARPTTSLAENVAPPSQPTARPTESAVILDLADWRRRRRGADQQSSSQRHTGHSEPGNDQADGQDHIQ